MSFKHCLLWIGLSLSILFAGIYSLTFSFMAQHDSQLSNINQHAIEMSKISTFAQSLTIPLYFEVNQGQTDPVVKYLTRGNGYIFYFTPQEIIMCLQNGGKGERTCSALKMQFVGANATSIIKGIDEQESKSHYFQGNDPQKWHSNISHYAKVSYRNLYPGIDVVFYGNQRQLEYDILVAPGQNPESARLHIDGAQNLFVDNSGNLHIQVSNFQEMQMHKPTIYQVIEGEKIFIEGQFNLLANNEIGFKCGKYDPNQLLVIDPVLIYSSFLGGSIGDQGNGIAVDNDGNAYVVGETSSANFPITAGAFQTTIGGFSDATITKVNATGTALIYSTYLGGSSNDSGRGIAVDSSGNAYVTGFTVSTDFPITVGAFQTTFVGVSFDAFVTKLDPTGSALVYSTYLGGSGFDAGQQIKIDASGNAYVTGQTQSTDFPTTSGAFQSTLLGVSDAFVTKLNPTGTALVYSTYLGGNDQDGGQSIALDSNNNAYVTGFTSSTNFPTTGGAFQTTLAGITDAFVTKLNSTGTALVYSTYLGGGDSDTANSITLDSNSNAYIVGSTASSDFPVTVGAFQTIKLSPDGSTDAFVTKFNSDGTSLIYSTYLGGTGFNNTAASVSVDSNNNAYIVGTTNSSDFPTTANAFQSSLAGGFNNDAFITKLNSAGTDLIYSTYFGGTNFDSGLASALDSSQVIYMTGATASSNFPVTAGAFQSTIRGSTDSFVVKFAVNLPPIVTALSPNFGPETGGTIVTITGANFAGTSAVFFGATPAASFTLISDSQIIATSPPGTGTVNVTVTTPAGTSALTPADLFYYQAATLTTLTVFPNPSILGQTVALTATVSPSTATGTIHFFDGTTLIGTVPVTGGSASLSSSSFVLGTHSLTAVYSGDLNFLGSTSNPVILVIQEPTTSALSVFPNPATFGQAVTLSATVSPSSATGTVSFFDQFGLLSTVPLVNGTASFITSSLSIGTHLITAVYNGDANFSGSTSSEIILIINASAILPPTHLKGNQKANRFATQTDYVNVITWQAPAEGIPPVSYRIYRNSDLTKLAAEISANQQLRFEDHNRNPKKTYRYFIVSVDQFGNLSAAATVTVKERK